MGIERIESVTYGVTDLETSARFVADLGLEQCDTSGPGVSFCTRANQVVDIRPADDPALPAGVEPGATIREVGWGVDSAETLARLGDDLARDREVTQTPDGALHFLDESGIGVVLSISEPVSVEVKHRGVNVYGSVGRWNDELTAYSRARPIRICHVALNVRKDDWRRAEAFYTERLHFRTIDRAIKAGSFLQCEGDWDHHNLGLFHRTDTPGINHVALEVADIDEVIEGGNCMVERGWDEARPLGRHAVGSNVFRFFWAPCGGRIELAADMSRVDESIPTPRVYEQTPPHHLWILKTKLAVGVEP